MTIEIQILETYRVQIDNAPIGSTEQIQAITSYYDYLASQGDYYGPLGASVASNQGDYGQFTNRILTNNGYGSNIDTLRQSLAIADISGWCSTRGGCKGRD